MGEFDNFHNMQRIKDAEKRLNKLINKRKPNQTKIDKAKEELENAKLFENCQIFDASNGWAPNDSVMFSDDNKMLFFINSIIPYNQIDSYSLVENVVHKAETKNINKGGITRAIMGGAIAGGVGAVIGATTAKSESRTTYYDVRNGFYLYIFTKDHFKYSHYIESCGVISNKIHPKWLELCSKLEKIIEENKTQ